MKDHFRERNTRDYHQKQLFAKEELEARESLCVHEEPPFCSAACPLRLDAREFLRRMAEKDFTGARAMLERNVPFPEILAHGCSHPCEGACRMGEVGESLAIARLEQAAMLLGAPRKGKGLLKFKKKKRAAVFGGELFTLVVAAQLAEKSYPVEFYVEEESPEALLEKCAPFLPRDALEREAARLGKMDISLFYGSELSPAFVAGKKEGFDLLCAAVPPAGCRVDEATLLGEDGILYPSSLHPDEEGMGACLRAFYDARRATVSADRMAQGLDPRAMRGQEGAAASRLYTNLSDASPSARVPAVDGAYDEETAPMEAARCIQCACEECLKGCVYLRHYAKHPRILTREIYNNTGIIMGDHMMNKPMNSCSLCGQCTVTCPNGYDMGEICRLARENMVDTGKMSLAVHEFALRDMLFSNTEGFLSCVPADMELEGNCRYVFFPGCQAGAVAPEAVLMAYRDLAGRLEGGTALMLGCCGAIAKWAGRREMFEEQKEFLRQELEKLGNPILLAACPTCKKTLEEEGMGEVRSLWEVLLAMGLPKASAARGEPVALQDACGARNDPELRRDVREIAGRLGFTLLPAEWSGEKTSCCGYGGLVAYANREMAEKMAEDCRKEAPDAPCITYCMACKDRLSRQGTQAMHLLELLYEVPAGAPPDISEKRKNRLLLKEAVLREFRGEEIMPENMGFSGTITEEARRQMDDRMILDTDVWKVMKHYRESGEAVLDRKAGLLVTSCRIGNVTFWVKFTEEETGYTIRGAYSHRMTVQRR